MFFTIERGSLEVCVIPDSFSLNWCCLLMLDKLKLQYIFEEKFESAEEICLLMC